MIMTTTTAQFTPAETVHRYVEFWNSDAEQQRELGRALFTEQIAYHAVPGVFRGLEAMIDFRTQFIGHVGSARYQLVDDPDHASDRIRLRWEIVLADGTSFAAGTAVLSVIADGRIESIADFLDRAPVGFDHH